MNVALKLLDYLSGQTIFVTWEQIMISECRKYCLEAIEVAEKLLKLSENGQLSCDDLATIFDSKNRCQSGMCAPAYGLCLMSVAYAKK